MQKLTVTTNVRFHWVKYDRHGGQKTGHWFGLSRLDGRYYKHFYQNAGNMKMEISADGFKESFEEWIKNDEYELEIMEVIE